MNIRPGKRTSLFRLLVSRLRSFLIFRCYSLLLFYFLPRTSRSLTFPQLSSVSLATDHLLGPGPVAVQGHAGKGVAVRTSFGLEGVNSSRLVPPGLWLLDSRPRAYGFAVLTALLRFLTGIRICWGLEALPLVAIGNIRVWSLLNNRWYLNYFTPLHHTHLFCNRSYLLPRLPWSADIVFPFAPNRAIHIISATCISQLCYCPCWHHLLQRPALCGEKLSSKFLHVHA